jgi:hypothetical protein
MHAAPASPSVSSSNNGTKSLLEEDLSPETKEHARTKHAVGSTREKNNANEKGRVSFDRNIHSCGTADVSFDATDNGCDKDNSNAENGNDGGREALAELITPRPCGKQEATAATGTGEGSGLETKCTAGPAGEKRKADGKVQVLFERDIYSYGVADDTSFNAVDGGYKEDDDGNN